MSFILAIVSSFSWAVLNLSRKKLVEHFSAPALLLFLSSTQSLFFYVLIVIRGDEIFIPQDNFKAYVISIVSIFLGNITFLKSIKLSEISSVLPILSFTPIFSIILSSVVLNEWLSLSQIIGASIIVIASFFIQSSDKGKINLSKGALYMILSSLCWAFAPIADKMVLKEISKFAYSFQQQLVIACVLITYFLISSPKELIVKWTKQKVYLLLLSVVASMFAIFFQFWSIEGLFVGIFEAFKLAVTLFLTLIFAKIFLQENINKKKIISVIIMIIGVFLISIKNFG
ncbi:MAG: DMT family transporter [Bdellovibrionales bacterium]|nr:DMT family transporter [Bdellovibrionales bacterium]